MHHHKTLKIGYVKVVGYWETDRMGIVHHSNYVKWFEEARCNYLRELGLPYREIEGMGYYLPVYSVEITYRKPAQFEDEISVETEISTLTAAKLTLSYTVKRGNDILATGSTVHPITDTAMKIQRTNPVHERISALLRERGAYVPGGDA